MFAEYIKAAMDKAVYEIIADPEPFYGEIPELQGIWATGKTLEACRDDLMSALEDWIAFRIRPDDLFQQLAELQSQSHRCR
jgi:predicted RNase H-like HicB family nuclease